MERDAHDSTRAAEREASSAQRRREAREGRHAERDERATGRDRLVEKRREGNASRRDFEASREGGGMMEFDEEALLGGSTGAGGGPAGPGSFEDAVKARERAQSRREDRKYGGEEKRAEMCVVVLVPYRACGRSCALILSLSPSFSSLAGPTVFLHTAKRRMRRWPCSSSSPHSASAAARRSLDSCNVLVVVPLQLSSCLALLQAIMNCTARDREGTASASGITPTSASSSTVVQLQLLLLLKRARPPPCTCRSPSSSLSRGRRWA